MMRRDAKAKKSVTPDSATPIENLHYGLGRNDHILQDTVHGNERVLDTVTDSKWF